MARWIGERRNHEYLDDILAAADTWRRRCFMADGSGVRGRSALDAGEPTGARRHRARTIRAKHRREDKSWPLLKEQLEGERPEILRLAAEAVWLIDLYPTTTAVEATTWKRGRFNELWNMSGSEPPENPHLSDRALQGIGRVHNSHWWVHLPLEFLLRLLERWKTTASSPGSGDRSMEIRRLAGRDDERISESSDAACTSLSAFPGFLGAARFFDDKKKIVNALRDRIPGEFKQPDRTIFEIRSVLEKEYRRFDFHDKNIEQLWDRCSDQVRIADVPERDPLRAAGNRQDLCNTARRCVERFVKEQVNRSPSLSETVTRN